MLPILKTALWFGPRRLQAAASPRARPAGQSPAAAAGAAAANTEGPGAEAVMVDGEEFRRPSSPAPSHTPRVRSLGPGGVRCRVAVPIAL